MRYLSACNFGAHDVPFDHLTFNIKGTEIKAVFYEHHGAVDVLKVGERPTPLPEDHEVLVEVVDHIPIRRPSKTSFRANELKMCAQNDCVKILWL